MSMERQIFAYFNGEREVRADPLVLRDMLEIESQGMLNDLIRKERCLSDQGIEFTVRSEGLQARHHLADITIRAFGLPKWDDVTGTGTLAEEALKLLDGFLSFLAQKKTPPVPPPTTSPPTANTGQAPILPTTGTTSV